MENTAIKYVWGVCFTMYQNATHLWKTSQNGKISFQRKDIFPFSVVDGILKKNSFRARGTKKQAQKRRLRNFILSKATVVKPDYSNRRS